MVIDVRERAARLATGSGAARGVRRDAVVVFGIALAMRCAMVVFSRGGPWGSFGYDGSVYYAAADALTFGRLPYRDFVLLHPPGVVLALAPFATFGRVVGDHAGYVAANVAFELLGALNAALVVLVARRLHLARVAAVLGGAFYAVWSGAVGAEFAVRLEPLGTSAFLLALLAAATSRALHEQRGARLGWPVLAGVALGVAVSTKIWWVVPAAIVVGWELAARRRAGAALLGGLAAALVTVNGVFFVNAPATMWRMVVLDQLGRPRSSVSSVQRIEQVASLRAVLHGAAPSAVRAVLIALAVLVTVACVSAWRVGQCRVLVVILAAQLTILLIAPSFFSFYSDYAAAAASLVLAAAVHRGLAARLTRPARAIAAIVVTAAAAATLNQALIIRNSVAPFPGARLARSVQTTPCVMSDSPMALIELNTLSRGLAHGCPNWVDVTGRTYNVDKPAQRLPRAQNLRWQHDLRSYLLSGGAVIMIRAGTGASGVTLHQIDTHPVIDRAGRYTVYSTAPRELVLP